MTTYMKFGESLKILLSILDISVSRLSKAINLDSSLISRWINERRTPSYKSSIYIENISEYLYKGIRNSFQENHINNLYLKIFEDGDINIGTGEKIKKILLQCQGYSIECRKQAMEENKLNAPGSNYNAKFLRKSPFYLNKGVHKKYNMSSEHDSKAFSGLTKEDKIIIGSKNILCVGLSLIEDASARKCDNSDTIYISFNNEMDSRCLSYYKSALLKAIENGWNVVNLLRLNNNIARTVKFIDFAWPLIITGKFTPYYFKKYEAITTEKEFVVIPGIGAILSLCTRPHAGADRAFLYKSRAAVEVLRDYFYAVLSSCTQPLIRNYTHGSALAYGVFLSEIEAYPGKRFMYKHDFSILNLPENLYIKLLQRKNMTENALMEALDLYKKRKEIFYSNLEHFQYRDFCLMEALNNLVKHKKIYLCDHTGFSIIDMEDQDIIYYLQNVVNMLERFDNYSIALLPKDSGNGTAHINFYCIVKEQKSMLLEAYVHNHSYPDVRLVIEEPMVIDACEDYFNEIWEQIPPPNRDKRRIIQLIRSQIDFVKNFSRKCN